MSPRYWKSCRRIQVLGMGSVLPGPPLATEDLLDLLDRRFGTALKRKGQTLARALGISHRHICRSFQHRREGPQPLCGNAELAAEAVRRALGEAGLRVSDLSYLIGHTATPAQPLPPNIAQVAHLLEYSGPYAELRQACTGFANALVMASGLLADGIAGPVAVVGSEAGSVFFDPLHADIDRGQLVNLIQMGDAAAAIVLGPSSSEDRAALISCFYGNIGCGRASSMKMAHGGSDAPAPPGGLAVFEHDFTAIRESGMDLFEAGMAAAADLGIDLGAVRWVIPHQANGRLAELLAPRLGVPAKNIFINADRVGNTGSAAIWLALDEARKTMSPGELSLVLGAEATKYMFGGFLYRHG